jgi:hypothetical protein
LQHSNAEGLSLEPSVLRAPISRMIFEMLQRHYLMCTS